MNKSHWYLEERIVRGVYAAQSKLPPERQLAEDFGVSRPSIRDALRVLTTRGLLEARQGDGYYVSDQLQQAFIGGWQSLLQTHDYLESDVLDFRRSLEGTLAALAAQRRTETDLERIEYWLRQIDVAVQKKSVKLQSQADVNFHQAIAEASHNVLFSQLSASLLRILHQHTQKNLANMFSIDDEAKISLREQHRAIVAAIRAKDAVLAQQLAAKHIDYVESSLAHYRQEQQREQQAQQLAHKDIL
ncbi:FadR/GntR family transcriptional regulator [Vitreoscilla stercoraria]|uniref:Pyruvate dehydrogenase complex repressor n=1 Tax=Vitreoscilla stercoraria TaxID=61 RepID=A0ABY4E7D8_VITST|nr:FadR/GntR family transcriptional regulator [Vitreoscilla stercoraria]UOO91691.1 FadR family transcriptional regulator [Vitreoscilla stercoraria]